MKHLQGKFRIFMFGAAILSTGLFGAAANAGFAFFKG